MEQFIIKRDGETTLEFEGELLAQVDSDTGKPRWSELTIYETKGGNIICQSVGKSSIANETDRCSGGVYPDFESAKEFFQFDDRTYSWLAMKLFEELESIDEMYKLELKTERIE